MLGIIAIIWTIDCFVGFYLTLPSRRRAKAQRAPALERELGRDSRCIRAASSDCPAAS